MIKALESFELVEELLGRPVPTCGAVFVENHKSRIEGMPTTNIGYAPIQHLPPDGVYSTITMIGSKPFKGLAKIGQRLSVNNFD